MIKILICCLFTCMVTTGFSQTTKKSSFEKTVKDITTAIKQKNNKALKKYIDPKAGLYLLYRNGVFDQYMHLKTFDLTNKGFPEAALSYNGSGGKPVRYARMPDYSCDNDKWTKNGTFADTSGKLHQLSETAKNLVKYEVQEVSRKEIKALEAFEKGNWKVIVADKNGQSCIFYLMYKNNRWYLSIIDTVTTDCSA